MAAEARARAVPRAKPRVVLVTRRTSLELLLVRHGTIGQARFVLETLGQPIAPHEEAHERFVAALDAVQGRLEPDRRRTRVDRDELDRFLFAPDDLVVVVGQDGLVANVAKYLDGQPVLGVNPDPERYDGVLCAHDATRVPGFLAWAEERHGFGLAMQRRTMAVAEREDGQRLLAVNEVFVGHRTHQSARYTLTAGGRSERQSSSGLLCATGTGATGWLRSICEQRELDPPLRGPEDPRLAWTVREPFPSVATGTTLDHGAIDPGDALEVRSEMGDGGTIFADGIESDRLEFADGQLVRVRRAEKQLCLVMPGEATARS